MSSIYEYKYPTKNSNYVGIEIEFYTRTHEMDIENSIRDLKLESYIELSDDGSIETPYLTDDDYEDGIEYYTCELKILCKQTELKSILEKVQILLDTIGAEVNSSCGLHVHLDMRNRNYKICAERLYNVQGLMLKSVSKDRRRNRFCKRVKTKSELFNTDRYAIINTTNIRDGNDHDNDKRTIEVRVHQGTTNMKDVFNWCKFLITTIDTNIANKIIRQTRVYPPRIRNYLNKKMASA